MPYQPRVTQGFQTNYAPALANFGAQIGAGIQEARRKREEKDQRDAFANIVSQNPFFLEAMGLEEGTAPEEISKELAKFSPQQQNIFFQMGVQAKQMDLAERKQDETERSASAREDIALQELGLKADMFNYEKLKSEEDYDLRRKQIEVNMKNAKTSEQIMLLREKQFELDLDEAQKLGTVVDLGGGAKAFYDGSGLSTVPGTESRDPADIAMMLNKVLDEKSPLGKYWLRTRNEDGTLAKTWLQNPEAVNPVFETTLGNLGLPSFTNDNKPSSKSKATTAPRRNRGGGLPTITTQEEYDALPVGTEFYNADGSRAIKE